MYSVLRQHLAVLRDTEDTGCWEPNPGGSKARQAPNYSISSVPQCSNVTLRSTFFHGLQTSNLQIHFTTVKKLNLKKIHPMKIIFLPHLIFIHFLTNKLGFYYETSQIISSSSFQPPAHVPVAVCGQRPL